MSSIQKGSTAERPRMWESMCANFVVARTSARPQMPWKIIISIICGGAHGAASRLFCHEILSHERTILETTSTSEVKGETDEISTLQV